MLNLEPPRLLQFQLGSDVLFGEGALAQLGICARDLGGVTALIVSDPGVRRAGHVDLAEQHLGRSGVRTIVFDQVEENPTTAHVGEGVEVARQNRVDLIVGLGGGSAMDCAKGINFILTNGGRMSDYRGHGKAHRQMLPSIGIPTTAGTGSEAQSYALITDETTHKKMACGDPRARFRTVLLDPALLRTLPRSVAAVTGMDAVSHALESYVCLRSNAVSRMFAGKAWQLLRRNYEASLQEPEDLQPRGQMLLGAHLAGLAVESSMLGAAHGCANPLTASFGITHGVAVGLMLPHVIRFNSPSTESRYDELVPGRADQQLSSSEVLAREVEAMKSRGEMAYNLRDLNVPPEALETLAAEAAQEWTCGFNPRPVDEETIAGLYREAF